jgi:hypothetical protein
VKIVRPSNRDFDIYQTPADREGMPTERLSLEQLIEVSRRCLDALHGLGSDCPRRLCPVTLSSLRAASLLERLEISHDVLNLAGLKLEPRHVRMNPLRERSLQI